MQISKDPTKSFRKQIQQTIHNCNAITDKNQQKYLLQMKPMVPKLHARPIINNIQAQSYKLAKYLSKKT